LTDISKGWGGHWRGSNATDETVICDLSYETRRSLNQMCALGYTVAASETNTFWASDLLHRLYHIPAFGWDYVSHFASDYDEVIELAESENTTSTRDSDTLQYFALEAYAFDISVPGVGCAGEPVEAESPAATSSAPAAPAVTSSTPTTSQAPSSVVIPPGCHTHGKTIARSTPFGLLNSLTSFADGGELHCGSD
jgi:hypothetical protein